MKWEQLALAVDNDGGLSVGDLVCHKANSELVGRIVEINGQQARLELLTWPTAWYRVWFAKRPMPARVENLILAEA
jgi:hypothetical protein